MQSSENKNESFLENHHSNTYIKNKIYVSNLEWSVHENLLRHFFAKFGSVKRCKILRYEDTNKSKGIAFVDFNDIKSVTNVLNAKEDEMTLRGRHLTVKMYEKKDDKKQSNQLKHIENQVSESALSEIVDQPFICHIHKIPYNVMTNIFSYLSIRDLCVAEQVCRRWYELARITWSQKKRLVLSTKNIFENYSFKKDNKYGFVCRPQFGKKAIMQILKKNLRNLQFFDISEFYSELRTSIGDIFRCMAETCPKLTHLLLNNLDVSNKNFISLIKHCPNLKVINMYNSQQLSDASIAKILQFCPFLEEFDFSNCGDITGICFEKIKPNNRNIQRAILNNCRILNWSYLEIFLKKCTNLRILSLKCHQYYSPINIRSILYNSRQLETLFLSPNGFDSLLHFDLETIEFQKLENLRELDIGRGHTNNELVACLLKKLHNLKILTIDECINLVGDPFDCLNITAPLEEINLNFNKYITDECIKSLIKFSSTLRTLKIKGCSALSETVINQIFERLDKLSYLNVSLNNSVNNLLLETALWQSSRKIQIVCNDTKVDPDKFIFDHPETIKKIRDRDSPIFEFKNLTFESLVIPIKRIIDERIWEENDLCIGPPIDIDSDEDFDFDYYGYNNSDHGNDLDELFELEAEMFKEI